MTFFKALKFLLNCFLCAVPAAVAGRFPECIVHLFYQVYSSAHTALLFSQSMTAWLPLNITSSFVVRPATQHNSVIEIQHYWTIQMLPTPLGMNTSFHILFPPGRSVDVIRTIIRRHGNGHRRFCMFAASGVRAITLVCIKLMENKTYSMHQIWGRMGRDIIMFYTRRLFSRCIMQY